MAVFAVRVTFGEQAFEHREGEAAGLAGRGLCGNHEVAALQYGGDGAFLNGSGARVAGGFSSQRGLETEGSMNMRGSCRPATCRLGARDFKLGASAPALGWKHSPTIRRRCAGRDRGR